MNIVTTIAAEAATPLARVCPGRLAPPATPAIFGAAEDLTKRPVGPALYYLIQAGSLPDELAVIGVDHNDRTTQWRQSLAMTMQAPAGIGALARSWRTECMRYMCGDFTPPETFKGLNRRPAERHEHNNTDNVLFYLAVSDRFFGAVVEQLGHLGPIQQPEQAWRRVIVERPFGHDLASAEALNTQILRPLCEDQADRIDHFLGKETVQNILVLCFANGIFEPLWNRDHVDPMQITAAKTVGAGGRGRFDERAGAKRDTVPFQFLAMIAIKPPTSFDADAVRACAPFHLRAGKCLSARATEIAVDFRRVPYALFRHTPVGQLPANVPTPRIQPDEGLSATFSASRRGSQIERDGVAMDFACRNYFEQLTTVGDETLICDCSIRDATLFQPADTAKAAWRAVQGSFDCRACDPQRACPVMTPPRVGAPGPPTA
jgi:glucose-6-phosphate 1-dehydrogenase